MNKKILFYISGHGFGHATRMCALIAKVFEFYPDMKIFVRTNAPEWIFKQEITKGCYFSSLPIDTGTYQLDFIHLDKKKSLTEYEQLINLRSQFLPREVAFLKENAIELVIGDIPPAAFYIASQSGIKSIGISNFSWDWIFEPYVEDYPEYKFVISDMQEGYRRADLLLRLPFACDFPSFRSIRDIPLLVRKPKLSVDEMRSNLGLENETRPVIMCSFGGFSITNFDFIKTVCALPDYFFIGFGAAFTRTENYLILPSSHTQIGFDHPSLVAFSDIVISKLGYSTVAECVSLGTPIMYISRDDFKEYPVLEAGLKKYIGSYLIPGTDFFSGNWKKHLDTFCAALAEKREPAACPSDGDAVAAQIVYNFN